MLNDLILLTSTERNDYSLTALKIAPKNPWFKDWTEVHAAISWLIALGPS
jgi:hypothetical protein